MPQQNENTGIGRPEATSFRRSTYYNQAIQVVSVVPDVIIENATCRLWVGELQTTL